MQGFGSKAEIKLHANQLVLSGHLNYLNIMSLYQQSLTLLNQLISQPNVACEINCAQITSSDSSGLALFLEWVKWAKAHHRTIYFKQLSQELIAVAKASGIESLIPRK